jgi:hypothetical protein
VCLAEHLKSQAKNAAIHALEAGHWPQIDEAADTARIMLANQWSRVRPPNNSRRAPPIPFHAEANDEIEFIRSQTLVFCPLILCYAWLTGTLVLIPAVVGKGIAGLFMLKAQSLVTSMALIHLAFL